MKTIQFNGVENKLYPDKQLALVYFISDYFSVTRQIEVSALTLPLFIKAVIRNELRIWKYWFLRLAYKLGFIEVEENEAFSMKCWRARWWLVLKRRKK